ncbi:MAG TPA: hypothetical protein VFR33_12055 [Candidatus Dormibacteraeota bacterium]|nr:hypothetical protein [Candidatus Dormibacteraeota bacterium]
MPSDLVAAADWIGPRLLSFADAKVGSVIPTGFESYVRLTPHVELEDILRRHTATPNRCWFCLWDGYGELHGPPAVSHQYSFWAADVPESERRPPPPPPKPTLSESRVHLPHRDYLLFTGRVQQGDGWHDGPNLWWPDDRAWCVANEIDLDYTLVGGSEELCADLIEEGAIAVSPDDRN